MINEELLTEIKEYCKLNSITDINEFINKILKQGFWFEKYGVFFEIKKKDDKNVIEKNDNIVVINNNVVDDDNCNNNNNQNYDFYGEPLK